MIKSELEIEQDVYDILYDTLKGLITGEVYKSGCRPVDAMTEDAVIVVSDASADQIQLGHVLINIYVTDINGIQDKEKLTELSKQHENFCEIMNDSTTDEYEFYPGKSARVYEEPNIHQHFVNLNIEFKRTTF